DLFFQAEDSIRDRNVTGVQTCALPILLFSYAVRSLQKCQNWRAGVSYFGCFCYVLRHKSGAYLGPAPIMSAGADLAPTPAKRLRSEERRVGKEGRSRGRRE